MNLIIFPNQLFEKHPGLRLSPERVILIEDSLFFGDAQYPCTFHKQKLWLHRATMKRYAERIAKKGFEILYIDHCQDGRLPQHLGKHLKSNSELVTLEPVDFILERRLQETASQSKCILNFLPNPGFLNSDEENQTHRRGKKRWFMADFYKWQRKRLNILMDDDQPVGGKWSFDADNRKKVPKKMLGQIPSLSTVRPTEIDRQAVDYVEANYPNHPGELNNLYYPTSHAQSKRWLKRFLAERFEHFGVYEDAIVEGQSWLWHSVLTPMLNIGLITPEQIVTETLAYADEHDVPLNSLEGFLRQIIGWREFMRATYCDLGVSMRTTNHWNHHRTLPSSFYDATTGIEPIDDTIRRILDTGYCHHIERLMVLGGFMFLCEIDPQDIYRWFMEMFVDSYDWVMVPNVYAMSQHADGGQITTKPYFSGSSYVRKMSNHPKGPWCEIWDGLYWRWVWNHADELVRNPRWAMMCRMVQKMDVEKRDTHLRNAENYLASLG